MPPLLERLNFGKAAIVLAVFVVALGLCGVTGYVGSRPGASGATFPLGVLETGRDDSLRCGMTGPSRR